MKSQLILIAVSTASLCFAKAAPLKVYILAGQSNMEGHAHLSTFPHIAMDPNTKQLSSLMQDENGKTRKAQRTWIF